MLRWLRPKLPLVKRRRIAVVGIFSSGKTVFLTSLINHLTNHSPDTFELSGPRTARIKHFRELPAGGSARGRNGDVAAFPFAEYRQHLIDEQTWPRKTFDVRHYRCRFQRTDTRDRYEVDFIDFPGERIADGAIHQAESFAAWSDAMFQRWSAADRQYRQHLADYTTLLERGSDVAAGAPAEDGAVERQVIAAYKLAACRLLLAYKPLISPASFLLALKAAADPAARPTAEQLAAIPTAYLGVDAESQFAPLTAAARARWPELAARFAERFARYKREAVTPLVEELVEVDRLIVLVDIPMILNAGPGLLNDCHAMLGELFRAIRPEGWLMRWLGLARRAPKKIAFVANKADLVVDEDRDNLKELLRELCHEYENSVHAEIGYFCVSPIRSTQNSLRRSDTEAGWLVGRPLRGEAAQAMPASASDHEFRVSRVPPRWPADWQSGDFRFPAVHPKVSKAVFQPPAQLNMPQLFEFIVT
jgi:predicted YcjX-like family ATPase